jgi:HEAT repeat protein
VERGVINTTSVERYVAGTLSEEELAEFEAAMIERPELAADVNVRRRIKAGLSLLEERKELEPLLETAESRPHYLRYAAAAAVVLVAIGSWTAWRSNLTPSAHAMYASAETGASKISASFTLARTRSAETPVLKVRPDDGLVQLRLLVDEPAATPVTARIGAEEISISQIVDGFAEIYLDPRELNSGSYVLTLKPQSGPEQRFAFELRISP